VLWWYIKVSQGHGGIFNFLPSVKCRVFDWPVVVAMSG